MKAGVVMMALAVLLAGPWAMAADKGEALTNADVVGLVKAGIDVALIKQKIQKSSNQYDTSADAMVALRKEGVPDEIISLMLAEAEKRRQQVKGHINIMIQSLASDIPTTKQNAYLELVKAGKEAHPKMIEALSNSDPKVRAASINALCRMEVRESVPAIKVLLEDSDCTVRVAAADAFSTMAVDDARKLAIEKLRAYVYQSPDSSADAYVRIIGRLKEKEMLPNCRVFLQESEDASLREQAAWALEQMEDATGRDILERILMQDRAAQVRAAAAKALGRLAKRESVSAFAKVIDVDKENRELYFRILSNFPREDAVPVLILRVGDQLTDQEKSALANSLRRLTYQDFGNDMRAWLDWWEKTEGKPLERRSVAPVRGNPSAATAPAPYKEPAAPGAAKPAVSAVPPAAASSTSVAKDDLPKAEVAAPAQKRDPQAEAELDRVEAEALRKVTAEGDSGATSVAEENAPEGGAGLIPKGDIRGDADLGTVKAKTSAAKAKPVPAPKANIAEEPEGEGTTAEVIKK